MVNVKFTRLQHVKETDEDRAGLLLRTLINETQSIRRCDLTKQGNVLNPFRARYGLLYTGSPVVDTINDLDGHLAFLESMEWSSIGPAIQPPDGPPELCLT